MTKTYATHLRRICALSEEDNPRSHSACVHRACFCCQLYGRDDTASYGLWCRKNNNARHWLGSCGGRYVRCPLRPLLAPFPQKSKSAIHNPKYQISKQPWLIGIGRPMASTTQATTPKIPSTMTPAQPCRLMKAASSSMPRLPRIT